MTFQKGTSGNPRGRPRKGAAISEFLRAELEKPYEPGTAVTAKERIARVIVQQACRGNLQAIAWLTERTEGKATERLDITGSMIHEHRGGLTDEERVERLASLYERVRARVGGTPPDRPALDAPPGAAS